MEAMSSFLFTTALDIPSSLSLHRKSTRFVSSYKAINNNEPQPRLKYPATPIINAPTWSKYCTETPRLPQDNQMVRQQRSSRLFIFINPFIRPFLDPKHVLSNNYAPVGELPPTACHEIEGNLPPCLNGAYLRNGPNPQYPPQSPYHLFDGDGMVHCLRISNGHATLSSRYVKTYKYSVERDAGRPVFPHILSDLISCLLTTFARAAVYVAQLLHGKYDPKSNGAGLANTSRAYFGGKLFTLEESDLPYQIQITPEGDIETVGRKNRYGYLAVVNQFPEVSGVVKLDWSLEKGREARCRMVEKGCFGGEPFYVPKRNNQTSMQEEEEEDDGYLVMYVHNENTGESKGVFENFGGFE